MTYVRKQINGTSPMDLKNLNDNMTTMWLKVFGDINMSDIQDDIKSMLYTNWLQINGEGNLDSSHELLVRFYIPPTTKKIKSSNLNLQVSRYRMDSGITDSKENKTYPTATSTAPDNTLTSGASSTGTTDSGGLVQDTSDINWWQNVNWTYPFNSIVKHMDGQAIDPTKHLCRNIETTDGLGSQFIDFYNLQHYHKINIAPHSHTMPHTHSMPHTHQVSMEVTIEGHHHDLNEGIKESLVEPSDVKCFVNNNDLEISLGENGTINDKDITKHLLIGQWNIIKITTTTLARVTVYGIAELLQNYK